ncbi:hypothetical protein GCM10007173_18990 [Glutamicibacter ardleyensis]|uniref:Uncharacterized protein n=1 Tax=Glutamicibacter ardleyensis TaxID=225894 RepID=A0ABQ2DKJ8_9MICC|nr:hypothetical protein GCM10007173_18990 [Glutamicibacter ardleyensis]
MKRDYTHGCKNGGTLTSYLATVGVTITITNQFACHSISGKLTSDITWRYGGNLSAK